MQPGFASEILIEAISTVILVEMARHGRQRLPDANPGLAARNDFARGRLAPWQLRRIHERLATSFDIGYPGLMELALLCNLSQSHLMRAFKVSTGWQVHKYVAEQRLNMAKQLLVETRLTVKEISARLGFHSPAYFATAFRRTTGKSHPSTVGKCAHRFRQKGGQFLLSSYSGQPKRPRPRKPQSIGNKPSLQATAVYIVLPREMPVEAVERRRQAPK